LITSAEIGQQLLDKNNQLEAEIVVLKARYNDLESKNCKESAQDNSKESQQGHDDIERIESLRKSHFAHNHDDTKTVISELERDNYILRNQIEETLHQHDAVLRNSEKRYLEAENQIKSLRQDMEGMQALINELEETKSKLSRDKTELCKRLNEKSSEACKAEIYLKKISDLEEAIKLLSVSHFDEKSIAESAIEKASCLERKCQELEASLANALSFQSGYEERGNEIDVLTAALEESRELINAMESRLLIFESKQSEATPGGDKSLFSEVEDRRQELEMKHMYLNSKHAGLVKAHTVSMSQQERLRNQISRLSQLATGRSADERVKLLERALGQSESERKALALKVENLQHLAGSGHGKSPVNNDWGEMEENEDGNRISLESDYGNIKGTSEIVTCLRAQNEQLTIETENLRRELRTSQLLRLSETDKLRTCEIQLAETELSLERANYANVELKYELDELKLRLDVTEKNGVPSDLSKEVPGQAEIMSSKKNRETDQYLPNYINTSTIAAPSKIDSFSKPKIIETTLYEEPVLTPVSNLKPDDPSSTQVASTDHKKEGPKQIYIKKNAVKKDECRQQ